MNSDWPDQDFYISDLYTPPDSPGETIPETPSPEPLSPRSVAERWWIQTHVEYTNFIERARRRQAVEGLDQGECPACMDPGYCTENWWNNE